MTRHRLYFLFALLTIACAEPTTDTFVDPAQATADASVPTMTDATRPPRIDYGPDLSEGWNVFEPGGDTTCGRGGPFRFAVRPGNSRRIVVEFVGGGACWDEFSCSFADALFNDNTEWLQGPDSVPNTGLYDALNPENPVRDYHHVLIPYCTGDIHWGNSTMVYAEGTPQEVQIEHRGATNVRAVLDWVEDNYQSPDQIFVSGCSAGAYGSIMWAPALAERYPGTDLVQLGDCGAGIITDGWFRQSFPAWQPEASFPAHIPSLDPAVIDYSERELSYLYTEVANHYTDFRFAQFNTDLDRTQVTYFTAMGGESPDAWRQRMYGSIDTINTTTTNFTSFNAGGNRHCIINTDAVYTLETEGVRFIEWLDELLNEPLPTPVRCVDCATE